MLSRSRLTAILGVPCSRPSLFGPTWSVAHMVRTPEYELYQLGFPAEFGAKPVLAWLDTIGGLLPGRAARLCGSPWPALVFEVFSTSRGLSYRLRLPADHAAYVVTELRTMIPGIRATPTARPTEPAIPVRVTEFGMRRPNRTVRVPDPAPVAASLLASLRSLPIGSGEAVTMQLVVVPAVPEQPPASNPPKVRFAGQRSLLLTQLAAAQQVPKDELADQRAKLTEPAVLAVLRTGAVAADELRGRELLAPVHQALRSRQTAANGFYRRWAPQPILRRRIVEARVPWLFPMCLTINELAALSAWPLDAPAVAGLPRTRTRQLPATGVIPSCGGPVLLRSDFPGDERDLCVMPADLTTHVLVSGRTGTGKTTLLCSVAEQLMRNDYGIVLIETKGDETGQTLFHAVLERIPRHRVDDCIVVDVGDEQHAASYNVLDEGNPRIAVERICGLFDHLYRDRGVYSREAFYHGLMTLIARPGHSFVDLLPLFDPRDHAEEAWREELIASLDDPELQDFWRRYLARPRPEQARFAQPLADRAWQLSSRPEIRRIFGQSHSTFNFREALEQHKVVLVNLSGVGEATALLAGTLLTNSLWTAIKVAKADKPNFVFLDEWPTLLDLGIPMDELLSRARGYQAGLFLAAQHPAGLPMDVRGAAFTNCASQVVFAGGNEDGRLFAREFGRAVSEDDFRNLGRWQVIARLAAGGETHGPVTGVTLPSSRPTGLAQQARTASRRRYSRPVAEVDVEIRLRRTPQQPARSRKKPSIGTQEWH